MLSRFFVNFLAAVTLIFIAFSAAAQATRTWVSGVGDDANPCSRTAPCKTFAGAISKTAAGGEINALDPAGFGALTITKSISIISRGNVAGVLVSGTNGIVVNVAPTDRVYLEGLDIEGLKTGLSGVKMVGSGNLTIRDTSIRNFGVGVEVAGGANARVFIENVLTTGNDVGVKIAGQGGVANRVIIYDSTIDSDVTSSLQVGTNALAVLSRSKLQGAVAAITNGGGTIESYGDNILRGTGAVTTVLPKN